MAAPTWRAIAAAVGAPAIAPENLIDVMNASGSGRVLRVYRAWMTPTGFGTTYNSWDNEYAIQRITGAARGTSLTPVTHDSTATALPAEVTAGTGRDVLPDVILRAFVFCELNPVSGLTDTQRRNWQLLLPNAEVWNSGYADPNTSPAVLREGYGLALTMLSKSRSSCNGRDVEIEFTNLAS